MWSYVAKRIVLAVVTIFIIATLTFFLMNAIPGGPFDKEKAPDPAVQAVLEERFGLNKPISEQYVLYIKNFATGNFGISLKNGRSVADTLKGGFRISAEIGVYALILAVAGGLFFGLLAAIKRNSWADRAIIFMTTLLQSVPSFVSAILLLLLFGTVLQWVKVIDTDGRNYVLPVIALALSPMAYITRLTKSSMLDVLGQDYIRTARAKGVSQFKIIAKHALRNGLLPIITYLGPLTAGILTGSLVVETVFTFGGLGKTFIYSIQNHDYPVIMAIVILLSTLMVVMTLISDLIYKLVDPRISFD